MLRLGHLGPAGTYNEEAALEWLRQHPEKRWKLEMFPTLTELLNAFAASEVPRVMVPTENVLGGDVIDVIEWLFANVGNGLVRLTGEMIMRIDHVLMALPGVSLADLATVRSKDNALLQCRRFIQSQGWPAEAVSSTAVAAKLVAEQRLREVAVIGSARAAEIYGLQILQRRISDHDQNFTRFVVFGGAEPKPTGHDKTTMILQVKDVPGALYHVLGAFYSGGLQINLNRIQSHTSRQALGDYLFLIEFDGHRRDKKIKAALGVLEAGDAADSVHVLGSYPKALLALGDN